ncbi:MAG: amidohydrolase family protein [Burkholderiales bacterium]|nr:amidohydrolase family protein [Burkholderiales bacterium]
MLALRNAHLGVAAPPGGPLFDLLARDGRLAAIGPAGTLPLPPGARVLDARGGLVVPCFADIHTHIDKTHVVAETGAAAGDLFAAIGRMAAHRATWTADQVASRMERALGEAWSWGTRMLRTHLDWPAVEAPLALEVFADKRRHWAGRVELQAVSLTPLEVLGEGDAAARVARALRAAGAAMGAFVYRQADLEARLGRVFRAAADAGIALDLHVDEGLDADAAALASVARLARAHGLAGRVVCGHACSLAMQPRAQALATLDACAAAGVTLVALPTTNAYLQGSWDETPVERGITRVAEARAAGVRVCFATDNVADCFYPYGGYDLVDIFDKAVLLAHLRDPAAWLDAITVAPAAAMGAPDAPFAPGAGADWVVFAARGAAGLLAPEGRARARRTVIRNGGIVDDRTPH